MISFELLAIICLVALAVGNLIVGVVNDAVNFLNSAIGARVTTRKMIVIISSIGIIIGATFSDGIIEVARKGIFHPEFFSLQEAIIIFTAVAVSDLLLLDLYSTLGLPTSTTVSVVFELLGAALVLAFWKMGGFEQAWEVINSASAIKIVLGILLSIGIAFIFGLLAQFVTRLLFTFDYKERLKKWGFIWSGVALTCLMFFLLIKGGKHANFMTADMKEWLNTHITLILSLSFVVLSIVSYVLIKIRANILKIIVLIGTASLAMAFAGNDLANFIGVSVGGVHAFLGSDLSGTLPTPTWVLLLAGIIMSVSIGISKKARTVTSTTINLASHGKGVKDVWKVGNGAGKLVDIIILIYRFITWPVPKKLKKWIAKRLDYSVVGKEDQTHFDLIRACVNLMVAATVISYATSQKLPLSTTYVTFMVAMGTALADGSWQRDCAPCRIIGILTVISGWFITALIAFAMSGIIVSILFFFKTYGLILLVLAVIGIVYKLSKLHTKRASKGIAQV